MDRKPAYEELSQKVADSESLTRGKKRRRRCPSMLFLAIFLIFLPVVAWGKPCFAEDPFLNRTILAKGPDTQPLLMML